MNELCILQDDVPPFPNQVKTQLTPVVTFLFVLCPFTVLGLNRIYIWFGI